MRTREVISNIAKEIEKLGQKELAKRFRKLAQAKCLRCPMRGYIGDVFNMTNSYIPGCFAECDFAKMSDEQKKIINEAVRRYVCEGCGIYKETFTHKEKVPGVHNPFEIFGCPKCDDTCFDCESALDDEEDNEDDEEEVEWECPECTQHNVSIDINKDYFKCANCELEISRDELVKNGWVWVEESDEDWDDDEAAPLPVDGTDIALIEQQCIHQKATTPYDYIAFGICYALAKEVAGVDFFPGASNRILSFIGRIAFLLDNRNKGYRTIPVVFANGKSGVPHANIERAMTNWLEMYASIKTVEDAHLAYKEFEEIHPYVDGNGRIGHLIWAMAMTHVTGEWPQTLPPDFWGVG